MNCFTITSLFAKRSIVALMLLATVTASRAESKGACEFVIVIPSYNNERYAGENLDSACWQKSTYPYEIIYVNDCSSDKTGEVVEKYVAEHNLEGKVRVIHNKERLGSGIANIYNAVHNYVADNKIVAILDGDDYLPHDNVLLTLEKYYENPDTWMAYSKLEYIPSHHVTGEKIPDAVYKEKNIRMHHQWVTALRTFRASLFKKIKKEDLCYKGAFMSVSWDEAFSIPMLEMCCSPCGCGLSHCVFIDDILYMYRYDNPINDYKTKEALQYEVLQHVRQLKPYEPLQNLFGDGSCSESSWDEKSWDVAERGKS